MAPQPKRPNQEAFDRAVSYLDEAKRHHGRFVTKVEERYKAYRGLIDETAANVASWTSKAHPPYIMHIVETTLASLIDDKLRFNVRPRSTIGVMQDQAAWEQAQVGARAHRILFDWQLRHDHFSEIQRPFVLQNAIAGLTVAKTYWTSDVQRRRHLKQEMQPALDEEDNPISDPVTGEVPLVPHYVEAVKEVVVYDGPTTEVRDVRDFMWHEAAVSLEAARYLCDRVWKNGEDIKDALEGEEPVFGEAAGGWPKQEILKLLSETRDFKEEYASREQTMFSIDRTKDLVEVVEVWDNVRKTVTTIANRKILLAHRPFPFWHEKPPFVVCSTQPDLFNISGISQVEKIAHLQTMLWEIQNQRIDNLRLINNAIFMFPWDIEDVDVYDFEPGARWPIEDPTSVNMWQPNVIPAEVSLGAEGLLKGDLQNLAGGFPFASGADSQTVDQKTATGASIVTGIAQRSINLAKQRVYEAWQRVGEQRMLLNQQFVREETAVPVVGKDGKDLIEVVTPMLLDGEFSFELEPVSDSMMKQEEQASAQALVQLAAQLAPIAAALSQAGAAKMINLDAFVEDLLKAFGKDNTDRYFTATVPPPVPGLGAQDPGAGGAGPAGPEGPGGITGPGSIDPAVSPSSQISQSPEVLMQRALASRGGGQSVAQA